MSDEPPIYRPHDVFFKELFGCPDVAGDFLRNYLPAPVVATQQGTFIDSELQDHFSDLLYRVPLAGGGSAFAYILFEHKSYPDTLAAFQLLRYMVRIWERVLRDESHSAGSRPLPPMLIYHGRTAWQMDTRFDALFPGPEELAAYWPSFSFQLTDLSRYSDEALRGRVLLLAALLTMKHIFGGRLIDVLPRVLRMVRDWAGQETGLEYLYTFLRYIVSAGVNVSRAELRQIVDVVLVQEGNATMATIAQEWIQEGKELGRQEAVPVVRDLILQTVRSRFRLSDAESESVAQHVAKITESSGVG